jgi:hypothetical protein
MRALVLENIPKPALAVSRCWLLALFFHFSKLNNNGFYKLIEVSAIF